MGSIFGNSGQNTEFAQWYAKAKAEYEAKKAREKSETQRQRLQNQAEQGSDPNFIGPDPKWYADAVSGYEQDQQTAKLASETLSQGQGPRALQVKMPGSSLLQAAEQLTAKPQTVPNLLTQEGKAQADLELEQALERYREPELSQSYFSDALQDKRNRDDKLLRAAAYIPSKVWSGFSTAVNNAGWGTLYGVSDFINSYTHDPVTRKIADTANWFLQNQDTANQQMDAYTDQYVPSAVNTYVGEALRGVGQSVPMLAEAYLTGGKSIADDLIKAGREAIPASLKLAGLSAGGGKYRELRNQGVTPQQALSNAVTSGLSEMAIERMGYDELLPFFRNPAVGSSVKNAAKQALRSGAAEGLEEMTSDVTGNLIDKATYDPGKKWFGSGGVVDPASMAASGATGALSGLMLGGVGAVGSQISDVDPRLEVYRDTRLQQTQNRGTINPTEVVRDGQGTQGTRYTAQTGESVSGINGNQANDSGRINIDSRGEIEVRQNLGRSIRNSQSYTERNIQTQDGAIQRYKEINTDVQMTPELQAIAEDNSRYGFSTVFVLDAMQEKGGVTKKQNGFYNNGTIYLDIESGHDLADVSRHELVHGGRDRNPDLFDDLYFSFYNNVDSNALQTAWEYYKQQYGANVSPEKLVEEFIADVAPLLDNPPTQEIFTDVDAVKQAYDVFFNSLGTKVNQQGSTQQAAEMDTGNGTDTRLEQQAGVQPDLQQAKETIAQYGDKTGRKVVWYNDQSQPEHAGANGYMKNGVLYINENAQNPYLEVFKHELFHSLPADAKQGVIDFFRTNVNEETPAFREFKAQEMQRQRQKNLRYSDADFWEEYAAQNAEFLLDEGYIEKLVQTDRSLAQKILDAIKRLLKRVKDIFAPGDYTGAVSTHESGRVSGLNDTRLRQAQRLYERALQNATPTVDGMKYSFAGKNAQQADMSALQRAQQMKESGDKAEDILRETGWFTGLDGQWRFELDDSQMKIDYDGIQQKHAAWLEGAIERLQSEEPGKTYAEAKEQVLADEKMPLTLIDVLDYPELYRQYPDMADMPVYLYSGEEGYAGSYNPDTDEMVLTQAGMNHWRRTLPHEIQHAIQVREGFDMGFPSEGAPTDAQYWNSAGEIEAREAGRRQDMTAQERRESLPMRNARGAVLSDGSEAGPRYSIETLPDGKRYVQADRQVITGNDPKQWAKQVERYINDEIRHGNDVTVYGADGDPLTITRDTAGKARFRNTVTESDGGRRPMTDAEYAAKLRAESHIDEISKTSIRGKKDVPDMKNHAFARDGFNYRTAYFQDTDGTYYKLTISVGKNGEVNTVYNVGKLKEATLPLSGSKAGRERAYGGASVVEGEHPIRSGESHLSGRRDASPSVTDSIPQDGETVNTSIRSGEDENTKYSMKRSQFYDSLQEAGTVDDKVKQGVAEQIDAFGYQPIANEQTMKKASEQISKDPEKRAVRFLGLDGKHATTDDVAEGFLLLKQYQDAGDYASAVEVAKKLANLGTEAGRNVQIYSVLERLTPEGMLKYATSELEKVKNLLAKEKGRKWMDTYGKKLNLTAEEAKWITDTMTRVQAMPDGRDRAVLLGEIQKRIQQKIPSSVGEKIRALQRISLLLNPKTVISRNMLSNVLMNPFWTASDFIASGIDKAAGKATGMRTTGLPSYRQQARGMKKGAYESFDDFRRGINTRDAAADNFKIGQGSAFKGNNKLSKALAALDRTTSFLLDVGDRPFFEGYFLESLNGQMKANNVTQPTADMIDIARQTALEKTWQDDNTVTRSAQKIRDGLNFGNEFGLGSIIVPFVKTPSNIAKAIVEFSPAGVVKGLVYDGNKLLRAVKNGTATPQMQRNFVNDVAKGMTGTIMYMIAGVLAANGLLTGSDDEKDKDVRNFKRNIQGIMQNSIKIGGKSYSYDWAQPIGGILTTMADMQNGTYSKDNMINTLTQAMTAGGNTLFEQSMLSGLSDFFGNYDGFMTSLMRAFVEAPSQFLPTLGKQIAETIDPVARRTQGNGLLDTAGNRMLAKIPGATKKLEPVVDVLGRDVMRYGGKNSLFNIFLNPANVNIANPTPVTTEVWRLYEQTGDTTVFPRVAPASFTDDGIKYEMTDKEQTQFQRTMGQEADRLLQKLMDSAKYQNADDAEKAELVADAVEESYDKAKKELIESRGGTPSKRLKKVGDSK